MSNCTEKHQEGVPRNTSKLPELPGIFAEAIAHVQAFILKRFDQEIEQKKLFYHNRKHINSVQCRSHLVFEAISPYLLASEVTTSNEIGRSQLLLDLCAVVACILALADIGALGMEGIEGIEAYNKMFSNIHIKQRFKRLKKQL